MQAGKEVGSALWVHTFKMMALQRSAPLSPMRVWRDLPEAGTRAQGCVMTSHVHTGWVDTSSAETHRQTQSSRAPLKGGQSFVDGCLEVRVLFSAQGCLA